jgi:hypothetical protein
VFEFILFWRLVEPGVTGVCRGAGGMRIDGS